MTETKTETRAGAWPLNAVSGRTWGLAVATAGVGYVAAYLVALIQTGLAYGLAGSGADAIPGSWVFTVPAQLVSMSDFGALHASAKLQVLVTISGEVSLRMPSLLLVAAQIAGIAVASRLLLRRIVTRTERLLVAAATGLTLALGTLLLAVLLPVVFPGEAGLGSMRAAGVLPFLIALVIGFITSYVTVPGASLSGVLRRSIPGFESVGGVVRVAALHLGLYLVIASLVLMVVLPNALGAAGAVTPLLFPLAAVDAFAIGHLGLVGLGGGASSLFTTLASFGGSASASIPDFSLSLWNSPSGWVWVTLLLAVVLAAFAGLLLAVRRGPGSRPAALWPITFVVYALAGLGIQLFGTVSGMVRVSGAGGSGRFGPAGWFFLVLALWGLGVEAAARLLAPQVLPYASLGLLDVLTRVVGSDAPGAMTPGVAPVPAAQDASSTSASAASEDPSAAPSTLAASGAAAPGVVPSERKKLSRRARSILLAATLVVVLIIAASVTGGIVRKSVYGPQATAEKFMQALERGDSDAALDLLGSSRSRTGLLAPAVYKAAKNRPRSIAIGQTTQNGDVASVAVQFKQGDTPRTTVLQLSRTGTSWLVHDTWTVSGGEPASIQVAAAPALGTVTVQSAGTKVATLAKNDTKTLTAFPGTYTLSVPGSKYFEAASVTKSVTGFGAAQTGIVDGFRATPTDALKTDALAAVKDAITACAASTDATLDNCPFSGPGNSYFNDVKNAKYTLKQMPTLDADVQDDGTVSVYSSAYDGQVKESYDYTSFGDKEHESSVVDFGVNAYLSVQGDKVVITSID